MMRDLLQKNLRTNVLRLLLIIVIPLLLTACKIEGVAQKGPYIKDSVVSTWQLDDFGSRLIESKTISGINDEIGSYSIPLKWSGWTEVEVTGQYYAEFFDDLSGSEITLSGIDEIGYVSASYMNINLYTHFIAQRTKYQVSKGVKFSNAYRKAIVDLKREFELKRVNFSRGGAKSLDLTDGVSVWRRDNANLLLFSGSFVSAGYGQDELNLLTDDFADDGVINGKAKALFNVISLSAGSSATLERLRNNLLSQGYINPPNFADLRKLPKWAKKNNNNIPAALSQSLETEKNKSVQITLSGKDDGTLTYNLKKEPVNGVLSGDLPNITYTPNQGFSGIDSFTFNVSDGIFVSYQAVVEISVVDIVEELIAFQQNIELEEDKNIPITLSSSLSEEGLYQVVVQPTHGSLSGTAPDLVYTPTPNYNGSDRFSFTVSDGVAMSAPAEVQLTINAVNDTPVSIGQSLTLDEDGSVAITLNGTDIDGDALNYAISTEPTHGSLSGTAPDITYTPNANYHGTDSFSVTVTDGELTSEPAEVQLTINVVNDTPAANAQVLTLDEDGTIDITLLGADLDNDALTYTISSAPTNGSLSGTAPDLVYTPTPNYNGSDRFSFTVSDGVATSAPAEVQLTINVVNDAPVAIGQPLTLDEDGSVAITLNGTDIDGDALNYVISTEPTHGSLSGTAPDITYTPNANYHGTDSFSVTVTDGELTSEPAEIQLIVNAVNDAPVATAQSLTLDEDGSVAIMLNGTDIDGDALNYAISTEPTYGSLSGTAPDITYTPNANYHGTDSFSVTVTDGELTSEPAEVQLTINAVNDTPAANAQVLTLDEDGTIDITLLGADLDNDALTYTISSAPTNGSLSGTAPDLVYTPTPNYNGSDRFSFTVSDSIATSTSADIQLIVSAVNDVPEAVLKNVQVNSGELINIQLDGTDIDGNSLTYVVESQPANGALSGTPPVVGYLSDATYHGLDSFTYTASDGVSKSEPVTVRLAVNAIPTATPLAITAEQDSDTSFILTAIDADNSSEELTYTITSLPSHGTLTGTAPNIIFTTTNEYLGNDSFTFKVSDGKAESEVVVVTLSIVLKDTDKDGVPDINDQFPSDPTETADLDGDGVGDNSDTDRDGDGVDNSVDAFPDNALEYSDIDNDGEGDNTDTDRDGDGISNDDEIAAGTDPDDNTSQQDTNRPVLTLTGSENQSTELASIELSGTVEDSGSGIASITLISDQYAGLSLFVSLDDDQWQVSAPLEVGFNNLTLLATDNAGNQQSLDLVVERVATEQPLAVSVTYPAPGAILDNSTLTITGVLQSTQRVLDKAVTINGVASTIVDTEQVTDFNFTSQEVTLVEGVNNFVIRATADAESVETLLSVVYTPIEEQQQAPEINVLVPITNSSIATRTFTLAGEVDAPAGLVSLTMDTQRITTTLSDNSQYAFQETVSFAADETERYITLVAEDTNGKKTTERVRYFNDQDAPIISINGGLQTAPSENQITEYPYLFSGMVSDTNLASLLVNDVPVSVEPSELTGNFEFSVSIGLESNTTNSVIVIATDQSGNTIEHEYLLTYTATNTLEILSPSESTTFVSSGSSVDMTMTIRVDGDTTVTPTIVAKIQDSTGAEVARETVLGANGLHSGTIALPGDAGNYQLVVEALDSNNGVITSSSRALTMTSEVDVPISVLSVAPANGSEGIEPNTFISVSFNRAIDTQKLSLKVYETAQGQTWVDTEEIGVDALEARGYELQTIDRNHELVEGNLSLIPGDKLIAFYPTRDFAYNADIYLDVEYDGNIIERSHLKTRPLPTFINGVIQDQLNQPIEGITVEISELGRTTVTNKNGAYSFGYGDSFENSLPEGGYELVINPSLQDVTYGSITRSISLQAGAVNNIGILRVPVLNTDVAFSRVVAGKVNNLLQNNIILDLTEASLLFPDTSLSGNALAQFYTYEQLPYPLSSHATPLWIYGIQPSGIEVTGEMQIDLGLPKLNGGYEYVPPVGSYVLLLGRDKSSNQISPVGVGVIADGYRLKSVGPNHYETLDVFGYSFMPLEAQDALKDFTESNISLPLLLIRISEAWNEAEQVALELENNE